MSLLQKFAFIIRRSGWALLALAILFTWVEQTLTQLMEAQLSSLSGLTYWVFIYGAASVVTAVIDPLIITLVVLASLLPGPLLENLRTHASSMLKETLRASGQAMTWGLLLIIPGLVRFLQFAFIYFIILFDPRYARGQVDALAESTRLVNKRFFPVALIMLFFSVIIPLIMTVFDEYSLLREHFFTGFLLAGFDASLSVFSILLLLQFWEAAQQTPPVLPSHSVQAV